MATVGLKEKVVIITGGNSGLGQAAAIDLAKRGCRLLLTAQNLERLEATKKACIETGLSDKDVVIVQGDITQAATRREIIDKVIHAYGRVDVLINNAGAMPLGFFNILKEEDVDQAYSVNVKAPFFMSQQALPHLLKTKGCIINISSCLATENYPGALAYAMSKSALDMFTKGAAIEIGRQGVRINSINPGMVLTETLQKNVQYSPMYAQSSDPLKEFIETHSKHHALQRCAQQQEVTEVIAFLASDSASYITGQTIYVDGGRNVLYHRNVDVVFPTFEEGSTGGN